MDIHVQLLIIQYTFLLVDISVELPYHCTIPLEDFQVQLPNCTMYNLYSYLIIVQSL